MIKAKAKILTPILMTKIYVDNKKFNYRWILLMKILVSN